VDHALRVRSIRRFAASRPWQAFCLAKQVPIRYTAFRMGCRELCHSLTHLIRPRIQGSSRRRMNKIVVFLEFNAKAR
jgi:hypothetical protein